MLKIEHPLGNNCVLLNIIFSHIIVHSKESRPELWKLVAQILIYEQILFGSKFGWFSMVIYFLEPHTWVERKSENASSLACLP